MVEMILARSIMVCISVMTGSIISTISRSLLAQLEEISFLEENTPVLQLNLVPAAHLDDNDDHDDDDNDVDDRDWAPGHPGFEVVACLPGHLGVEHVPEAVPGQQLPGVRVGQQGHPVGLGEGAQLLRNHTATLQVDLGTLSYCS